MSVITLTVQESSVELSKTNFKTFNELRNYLNYLALDVKPIPWESASDDVREVYKNTLSKPLHNFKRLEDDSI